MTALDLAQAKWAWQQVKRLMSLSRVQRGHVVAKIGRPRYDRLNKPDYAADEGEVWREDLCVALEAINELTEASDPRTGIRRRRATSWAALFEGWPGFPASPEAAAGLPPMDAGASALGAGWNRAGFEGYLQELQSDRARWQDIGDDSKGRQVSEKLASLYEAVGDWDKAITHLYDLRTINLRFKDAVFVADCDLRLGIAFYRLGKFPEAEDVIQQGLAVARRSSALLSNSKTQLRLLGYHGLVRLRRDDPNGALEIFNTQVERIVRLHDSTYVTATFHHRRAIIQAALRNFDDAHHDIAKALELRIDCAAEFEATRSLYYLGSICAAQGHPRSAISIWRVCEHRHLRFKDALGLARVKLDLGNAFLSLAKGRGAASEKIDCSVHEADLSDVELAAVAQLAQGAHPDAEGGLRVVLRRGDLPKLAGDMFHECRPWALQASAARIVTAAEAGHERLRRFSPAPLDP
jgi:tetratricopeptide (TPR) repeat protein